MKDLRDAVALVTGAGSGIGRATAVELARQGCRVALNDLRAESLGHVEEEIRALSLGRNPLAVSADVSDRSAADEMCEKVMREGGRVDILVNNAGVGLVGRMEETSIEDWEWIMGINLWAHIHTVRKLLPPMLERGSGHLVHVSSGAGLVAAGPLLAYAVTKFAVVGLAEALAAQVRSAGIGVTVVCPYAVKTSIIDSLHSARPSSKEIDDFAHRAVENGIPPEEVARKIVRAIRRNRFMVYTHPWFRFAVWTKALWPQLSIRINARLTDRLYPRR
ncbi:MAG: SDR family oxidoreductase [Nitrospirae bacterium]|nr:SDR family oxidoreductase [Nitrospirota bacterium]